MANIKSAKKRAKQTVVRNARNTSQRSMLRTLVKKVVKALETKDLVAAEAAFVEAVPVLEKALAAPARPGRELADQGRRSEIEQALAEARGHAGARTLGDLLDTP